VQQLRRSDVGDGGVTMLDRSDRPLERAAARTRTTPQARALARPVPSASPLQQLQRSAGNAGVRRLLRAGLIQRKVTVNQPGDAFEQEADRVAEDVMRMPAPDVDAGGRGQAVPGLQRRCAECEEEVQRTPDVVLRRSPVSVSRKCAACEAAAHGPAHDHEEEEEQVKRNEETTVQAKSTRSDPPEVSVDLSRYLSVSRGAGTPLSRETRAFFEPRFGRDFGSVRVHTDHDAAAASNRIHARAFTAGADLYFARAEYRPGTDRGDRLLGHELTHVVQQSAATPLMPARVASGKTRSDPVTPGTTDRDGVPGALIGAGPSGPSGPAAPPPPATPDTSRAVRRQPEPDQPAAEPGAARRPAATSLSVSLSGLMFTPPEETVFMAGPKLPQGAAMVLRRLVGSQYEPGMENELVAHLQHVIPNMGIIGFEGDATEGERLLPIHIDIMVSGAIIGWANANHLGVALSESQRELLYMGVFAGAAWDDLQLTEVQDEVGYALPPWYTHAVFTQELGRQATLLRAYADAALAYRAERNEDNRRAVVAALDGIVMAILPGAAAAEAIKEDDSLREHDAYIALFGRDAASSPAPTAGQPAATGTAAPSGPLPRALAMFITFLHSQPELSRRVTASEQDHEARVLLLDRFLRYLERGLTGSGDQRLTDRPGGANAEPHPASLTSYPQLEPPLFDAALGTDHRFVMTLQFPSVFDAFALYAFDWDRVRVPDDAITGDLDLTTLEGETPTAGEVAGARFGRAGRYLAADMERTIGSVVTRLGPPGLGAPTLALANGILRFIGAGIRLAFELLTMPQNETGVVFPEEGLYVVRCKAVPILDGDEEIVRAPSVAFMPVFARHPQEMADVRVRGAINAEDRARDRIIELQLLLSEPVSHINQEALEREYEALSATLGSVADLLEFQRAELDRRRAELPEGAPERAQIDRRIEELDVLIRRRRERAGDQPLDRAERLPATFVTDEGHILHLVLEAVELGEGTRVHEVYVSDVTTRRSGQERGTGPTKAAAIEAALTTLLEGPSGYGRGFCAVSIEGSITHLRIEASEGMLLMEAIENLTTVASIAAVAAAPLTGGASLSLLLPIGLVGAIPSAYRLASRAEAGTLELDLETAMDILNIVGGVTGAAQAATGTRALRLGRALMVVGIGADGLGVLLMGAGIMEQIAALEGLPQGLRAARMMEIMGHAMVNAGIMVGAALAARRFQMETEIAASDPRTREWTTVRSEGRVNVGGEPHQISVGVVEGRLVIRICSDCKTLLRAVGRVLRDPVVEANARLHEQLSEVHGQLDRLDTDIINGRIDPATAQQRVDAITNQLNEMAAQHPDTIRSIIGPETPAQHERRNIMEDQQRRGEETPHSFTLTEPTRGGGRQNSFTRIARELQARIAEIVRSGAQDPVPNLSDAVLRERALDIVMSPASNPELARLYQEIYRAVVERHGPTLAMEPYRYFSPETLRRMRNELEKFDRTVARSRPDVVDFDLLRGTIHVSDITFDAANPVHNLKTMFYAEVMRRMTGLQVSSAEISARSGAVPVVTPLDE
jgi:uncharacterized protein DUF4157